ncbi:MAG TPA: PA2169 family four-helix-bundle protein [Burkholderiaceae bacterium]
MTNDEIISTLNDLIKTCNDGKEGFKTCADDAQVSSPRLISLLRQREGECANAAAELGSLVRHYGATPVTGTTAAGAMHRGWLNVKTAITGKSDAAVLEECERGEDIAKKSYSRALAQPLPDSIRTVVERQYQGVLRNHDQIKMLRDEAKAHA